MNQTQTDNIQISIKICDETLNFSGLASTYNEVKETANIISNCILKLKNVYPGSTDKHLMALALFQFTNWYLKIYKIMNTINNE